MEPFVWKQDDAGKPAFFYIERWQRQYPEVAAGFTSRIGGVSVGHLGTMNCALHVADEPERVIRNRSRLAAALGVPFEAWTCAEQVHGCRVAVVGKDDRGRGRTSREDAIPATDALVTNEPGVWLTAFFADCVPLYFFDPVRRAVGLAHAGWKGTVLQIARETVKAMEEAYGSLAGDMLAAIGPSIGSCCYEVDETVIARIEACLDEIGANASDKAAAYRPAGAEGRYRLSLQETNRQIMIKAGILPTHIEISEMCTGCDTRRFYSHRKERGATGRMAAWIGLSLRTLR